MFARTLDTPVIIAINIISIHVGCNTSTYASRNNIAIGLHAVGLHVVGLQVAGLHWLGR
jgi:hypothetical protein